MAEEQDSDVEMSADEKNVVDSSDNESLRDEVPQKRMKEERKAQTIQEQIGDEEEKRREFSQLISDEVERQKAISPALNAQAKRGRGRERAVRKEISIRRKFLKNVSYEIERQRRVPQLIVEIVEKRRKERDKRDQDFHEKICQRQKLKKEKKEERKNLHINIKEEPDLLRQNDWKMLYIKGLPHDITVGELKSLSNDIVDVSILNEKSDKTLGAVISFNTEAEAESNFKALRSKKLRDQPLMLDFYGARSMNSKMADEANLGSDCKTLCISGIPEECTIEHIAKHFNAAKQIFFNKSSGFSTAKIVFPSKKDAQDTYEANKEIKLFGHKLTVLYSTTQKKFQWKRKRRNARRNKKKQGGNPAKKLKLSEESVKCEE